MLQARLGDIIEYGTIVGTLPQTLPQTKRSLMLRAIDDQAASAAKLQGFAIAGAVVLVAAWAFSALAPRRR